MQYATAIQKEFQQQRESMISYHFSSSVLNTSSDFDVKQFKNFTIN